MDGATRDGLNLLANSFIQVARPPACESYDRFVDVLLPELMRECCEYYEVVKGECVHVLRFREPSLRHPQVMEVDGKCRTTQPWECMGRRICYEGPVVCSEVCYTQHRLGEQGKGTECKHAAGTWYDPEPLQPAVVAKDVHTFSVPIAVKSKLCATGLEPLNGHNHPCTVGGHFITKGHERFIPFRERTRECMPTYTTKRSTKRGDTRYVVTAEVRSSHPEKQRSTSTLKAHLKEGRFTLDVPFLSEGDRGPSLAQAFRILGMELDECRRMFVVPGPHEAVLAAALRDPGCWDMEPEEVLREVAKRGAASGDSDAGRNEVRRSMWNEFLPHCGPATDPANLHSRLVFLSHMLSEMHDMATKQRGPTDKDHYQTKKFCGSGELIVQQLRVCIRNCKCKGRLLSDLETMVNTGGVTGKGIHEIARMAFGSVTSTLRTNFTTGQWGQRNAPTMQSTVQLMATTNVAQQIPKMSVTNTNSTMKDGKLVDPRLYHPSQFGVMCPFDTPEGSNCGLSKNFSIGCKLRPYVPWSLPRRLVMPLCEPLRSQATTVFVDWAPVGSTADGVGLIRTLREQRANGTVSPYFSIWGGPEGVFVECDWGVPLMTLVSVRALGTLGVLEGLPPRQVVDYAISRGIVCFMSKSEERDCLIASRPEEVGPDTTHILPTAEFILSNTSATVVYANHTQAPRLLYYTSMMQGAAGGLQEQNMFRCDTRALHLVYPELPVTSTRVYRQSMFRYAPLTQNVRVLIATYGGANQEDAVIINRNSVQRGLFQSLQIQTVTSEEYTMGDPHLHRLPPDTAMRRKESRCYHALNSEGLPREGSILKPGDCVIGKIIKTKESVICASEVLHGTLPMQVYRVFKSKINPDRVTSVSVILCRLHTLEVGDKVTSRHGQKGVCARLEDPENLPFDEQTGEVPDLIMNPHGFPTRMTTGQWYEMEESTRAIREATFVDGSPFLIRPVRDTFVGTRRFRCGRTGERIRSPMFMGWCAYMTLRQQVSGKLHARDRGKCQALTGQPTEGRSRDGGLRYGEMEKDAALAAGAGRVNADRMCFSSDATETCVCSDCNMPTGETGPSPKCHICGGKNITRQCVPRSLEILHGQLLSAGVNMELITGSLQ